MTEEDMVSKWEEFRKEYERFPDVLKYIENQWLREPIARRFLRCYTKEYLHFDNVATSRVEGAHWSLKRDLQGTSADLLVTMQTFERAIKRGTNYSHRDFGILCKWRRAVRDAAVVSSFKTTIATKKGSFVAVKPTMLSSGILYLFVLYVESMQRTVG
ncbi:hypothetical protein VTN31DRAFT_5699 [Thermomyces dupontii]|uniref:uncharacterized protein n=1 Tax=Talaromyces thermophilus TaxID=28565 RepID=UPI003742D3EA